MEIRKRTFEAINHPKGSPERNRLNDSPLTSEYMTSYKYCILLNNGKLHHTSFRTKQDAELAAEKLKQLAG